MIYSKYPLAQLEASRSSIKAFKNLLYEIKGFKYQITVKALLRKHIWHRTESAPVCFNSVAKTIINSKYMFVKSFLEILYKINNWINDGCGWLIESIDAEYVNISIYSPLSSSSYI